MRKRKYDSSRYAFGSKTNKGNGSKSIMRITKKLLLPRIKRKRDAKLEKFVVQNINKELKNAKNDYDLVQMQYFLESVYYDQNIRKALLSQIKKATIGLNYK